MVSRQVLDPQSAASALDARPNGRRQRLALVYAIVRKLYLQSNAAKDFEIFFV